jgi:myo-inositol-1-phosphate synthase
MEKVRLGKRSERRWKTIPELVPIAPLTDLVFGGWDIYPDDAFEAAMKAEVLSAELLRAVEEELRSIRPMPAVFDPKFVRRIDGPNVKRGSSKLELAEALVQDIGDFAGRHRLSRLVMVWCGSTEVYQPIKPVHQTIEAFEAGLKRSDPDISPSMMYAWASIRAGVPYVNGSPNTSVEIPALARLALERGVPIAGKDFKTGQTLMKTILAPGLRARMLGVRGWFSTNILGNRDGEVLDDPGSFSAKEKTKQSVLTSILDAELYPELYGELYHKVRIEYHPPRGDAKEGWDNIDIFGWTGAPMQIKIDFLCRNSILAAPIVLDLLLFMDLAQRAKLKGIQEWLSFYFKAPMARPDLAPIHDLFIQHLKLTNTLRLLSGEEVLHHTGMDYYEEEPAAAAKQ